MGSVILTIDGMAISGWKEFSVKRALEGLAASFSLSIANTKKWDAADLIRVGKSCKIEVERDDGTKTLLVTGYIDSRSRRRSGDATEFSVEGRDKTADLVDCAAIRASGSWTRADLRTICRDLCAPYGIEVVSPNYTGEPFEKFTLQSGETAFSAIDRACRMRATIPTTNAESQLVLSRAIDHTYTVIDLVDDNLLELSENEDGTERFSTYIVKGQSQGDGDSWSASNTAPTGSANDPNVTRPRTLQIMAEGKANATSCKERALWEAQVRAGRSKTYSATVRGWFQGDNGPIWDVNQIVTLTCSAWGIQTDLLITGVEYRLDSGGRKTTLELKHPDTYKPNPTEPTKDE
jgi:prophage tail gpP-like protein